MASFVKRGQSWEAQVCTRGVRRSGSFDSRREATEWAAKIEAEILAGVRGEIPNKPFSALLERYRDEVSSTKRGERWERLRIGLLLRDEIAGVPLPDLNSTHFAKWRDRRLQQVSEASVIREWNLLSHALSVAMREWRWLRENPLKLVRRPREPQPRDRRISVDEIERLLLALGYSRTATPKTRTACVGAAFLFAIETAMRAGEIVGMKWGHVKGAVAYLPMTKNGFSRSVALSPESRRILDQLPRNGDSVFGLKSAQVDALFRKAKARACIENMHFHDTRHEAITRLAKKLDVLDLARMVGIRDLRILMVYYNARAEEIAQQLAEFDGPPPAPRARSEARTHGAGEVRYL